jgi:small neutral amino acid transporter SnatA (MarC family)
MFEGLIVFTDYYVGFLNVCQKSVSMAGGDYFFLMGLKMIFLQSGLALSE